MNQIFHDPYTLLKTVVEKDVHIDLKSIPGVYTDLECIEIGTDAIYENKMLEINMLLALTIAGKMSPGTFLGDVSIVTYFENMPEKQNIPIWKCTRWITFSEKGIFISTLFGGSSSSMETVSIFMVAPDEPKEGRNQKYEEIAKMDCVHKQLLYAKSIFEFGSPLDIRLIEPQYIVGLGNYIALIPIRGPRYFLCFPKGMFGEAKVEDVSDYYWNLDDAFIPKLLTTLANRSAFVTPYDQKKRLIH